MMMKTLLQKILLIALLAIPFYSQAQITLLQENFTYGVMPVGWTQDSAGVAPFYTWSFDNPGLRYCKGSSDTTYAIFDSDHYLTGNSQDCYLNLPSLNASALTSVLIVMKEAFRIWTGSFHQIEVSVNGGTSWTSILTDSTSAVGGINSGTIFGPDTLVTNVYDITTLAAGQADLRIRLRYKATWGYYWIVDDIKVTDTYACTSPPTPGYVISARPFSCNTDSFQLALYHNTAGSGQTYQWLSSSNGVSWNPVAGATAPHFMASQSAPTYYQCVLTCAGFSSTTDSLLIGDQLPLQYAYSSDPYTCDSLLPITLTLSPTIGNNGQTYQWESSPNGIAWNPITGLNNDTASVTQASATYYHCMLTCGTATMNSDSVFVNDNPTSLGSSVNAVFYVCNPTQAVPLVIYPPLTGSGLSYQWESSPDGTTWGAIVGATNDTSSTAQSAGTYYHCMISCGLSFQSTDSIYVGQYHLAGLACYCLPDNTNTCLGTGDYISNVTVSGTTLNYSSTCMSSNGNNSNFIPVSPVSTANLTRGNTYSLSVNTSSDNITSMWIDYNGDGVYDASEWVQVSTTSVAGVPSVVSFTVPTGAIVGAVGMRVRSRAVSNPNAAIDACTLFGSGETEDYEIGIETNVGLNSTLEPLAFYLTPNPSNGKVNINLGSVDHNGSVLRVTDVFGKELQSSRFGNRSQMDLDLSALSNGLYFVQVTNGSYSYSRRLVINR